VITRDYAVIISEQRRDMSAADFTTYLLRLADNALVLGHRLSEWSSRAPMLEEDIALANLALDLVGQARLLYDLAGRIEGKGRDEDAFAYRRDDHQFLNVLLVEQPNGDFAVTMARQFLFAAWAERLYARLASSRHSELAAIAAKAEKEMAYHVRHAGQWIIRLGDGTAESQRRCQRAFDDLMIYADELFETDAVEERLIAEGIAIDPKMFRTEWEGLVDRVLAEANLVRPAKAWGQRGGRNGRHSEHLSRMLGEMQSLHRAHPGVTW
jgi:ring-1,2-phenylacetyl-CoA epoxidase subunit PaaC